MVGSPQRPGRPVTLLLALMSGVLSLMTLYMPQQFFARPLAWVNPYLTLFGVSFSIATLLISAEESELGVTAWSGNLGRLLASGTVLAWGIMVALLPRVPTGILAYGLIAAAGLAATLFPRSEERLLGGFHLALSSGFWLMLVLWPQLFVRATYGPLLGSMRWMLPLGFIPLAVGLLLERRWPRIARLGWLSQAAAMIGLAVMWYQVPNWLGVAVSAVFTVSALSGAFDPVRPAWWRMPMVQKRTVAVAVGLAVLPVYTLGAVLVNLNLRDMQGRAFANLHEATVGASAEITRLVHRGRLPSEDVLESELQQRFSRPRNPVLIRLFRELPAYWASRAPTSPGEFSPHSDDMVLYCLVRNPESGLAILVTRDRTEVFGQTATLSRLVLFAMLLIGGVAGALALVHTNRVLRRLVEVQRVAQQIAAHQFGARVPLKTGRLDYSDGISAAVNEIAATLEAFDLVLGMRHEELLVQAEKLQSRTEALQVERRRLRAVLQVLPAGVFVFDQDGEVVEANQAARGLWGPSRLGAASIGGIMEMTQSLAVGAAPAADSVAAGPPESDTPVYSELVIGGPDGVARTVLTSASPIVGDDGEPLGTVAVEIDISERKRMEEALRESEAMLAGQNSVLEMIARGGPLQSVLSGIIRFTESQSLDATIAIQMLDETGMSLSPAGESHLPLRLRTLLQDLPVGERMFVCGTAVHRRERVVVTNAATDPVVPAPIRTAMQEAGFLACWAEPILSSTEMPMGALAVFCRLPQGPTRREENLIAVSSYLAGIAIERSRADEARTVKLQSLIQNMAQGVLVIDEQRRLLMNNAAAHRILDHFKGTPGHRIAEVGLPPGLCELLIRASQPDSPEPFREVIVVSGREVEAVIYPVTSRFGPNHGAFALLRDVTQETQFRRLQESFVANVSHELKGPLASMSAMMEALVDGLIPAEQHSVYLRRLLGELGRLQRLTLDLIDLSRLESGATGMDIREFDLDLVLEGIQQSWAHRCAAADIHLEVERSDLRVMADFDRVEQVLTNLLDNAVRFTPANGWVRVGVLQEGEFVAVSVADTGIGIAPEHQPFIWERFYKVDAARTPAPGRGTGLGLAIVKQLVERMGGQITVSSVTEQGSTFRFTLPVA